MRAVRRRLRSRAVVRREVRTSDGQGGWTNLHADLDVAAPCRRRPAGDRDQVVADQLQAELDHVVYFLPEQDVARGDQVVVDGYELLVEATWTPSDEDFLVAACSQTQIGA